MIEELKRSCSGVLDGAELWPPLLAVDATEGLVERFVDVLTWFRAGWGAGWGAPGVVADGWVLSWWCWGCEGGLEEFLEG